MDVSKQLQAYEVEYHVLQDELLDTPPTLTQQQRAAQLERTNQSLRQQNLDLLEEVQVKKKIPYRHLLVPLGHVFKHKTAPTQVSHARVCSLEGQLEVLVQSDGQLREQVSALEQEKTQLLSTVSRLQDLLNSLGIHTSPDGQVVVPPDDKLPASLKGRDTHGPGGRTEHSILPHPLALPETS